MPNRVLIVDDHAVVRMGVRTLLALNPNLVLCGETADGEHAILEFERLAPDVVILDLSLPVKNGFEVASEIRRIAPATKIIFFSMHEVPATTKMIGADAFVAKTAGIEALLAAVERCCNVKHVAAQDARGPDDHLNNDRPVVA
jgi:DNA-binding NarL/FixJ family response regulator